jgi:hypothetical protein
MADEIQPIAPIGGITPVPDNFPIHNQTTQSTDSVALSTPTQVLLLKQEGQSNEEIGVTLGIPMPEVLSDLGITTAILNGGEPIPQATL